MSLVPIFDSKGRVNLLLFTLKDVTESHRTLHDLQRTNRALKTISLCNSLLIHAAEEHELLEGMCGVVVETGGYLMAWIGFAEQDGEKTVKPVAQSGHEEHDLSSIKVSWGDNELGQGPTGMAIRTGTTQINQNCMENPNMRPWRSAALERGYQSSIALPLVHDGHAFGVLTIYASEPDAFREEEVGLLEQLAGDLSYGVCNLRSGAARLKAEKELGQIEERYRKLFDNGTDAIALADAETGELIDVNHAMEKLVGWEKSEIIGKSQKILHPPEPGEVSSIFERHRTTREGEPIETQVVTQDGMIREVEIKAASMNLDGRRVMLGFFRDISEHKRFEAQFEYQATHDSLTGLANRSSLSDRIELSMIHSRRAQRWIAVMLLDLDRFKLVNDSLGHDAGDALICEVAGRLSHCLRPGDTAARLGGDEFAVVMSDLSNEEDTVLLARKLLDSLMQPLLISGREITISASLGIAIYPRDGEFPPELIKNADAAMYRAKELGGNSFQFYSPEMNVRMLERLELENGLRRALERKEFELYYQPKVDLLRGHIVGAEALIRWNHPELGQIPPGDFIPLAEETGLIVPIGEWVIDTACAQIRHWKDHGHPDIAIAINLSARQFQQKNLPRTIERGLRLNEIEAQCLELEVTESVVMSNPDEAIPMLQELKRIGFRISLDDFGTGYSSLSYLRRFPIDSLKIDQSFVRDITIDPDDAAITKLVIALAHSMNRKVIAEGVETEAQLKFLQKEQCDEIQGYYFSKPVPVGEITGMLVSGKRLETSQAAVNADSPALLLVDDEENILNALFRVLRRDGYRILKTTSAREALQLMAANEVGVILSDQRMPEMDGVNFLRRAKQLHPDSIRLVLSGYTDLKSVTDAINEGAVYKFLTKPWEDEYLRENIREAFQRYEMKQERDHLMKELAEANEELSKSKAALESMVKAKTDEALRTLGFLKISQEVLECLPNGVIGVDEEGLIVAANKRAERIFGKGIVGMLVYDKLPSILHEGIRKALRGIESEIHDLTLPGFKNCWGCPLESAIGGKGALLVVN